MSILLPVVGPSGSGNLSATPLLNSRPFSLPGEEGFFVDIAQPKRSGIDFAVAHVWHCLTDAREGFAALLGHAESVKQWQMERGKSTPDPFRFELDPIPH